MTSRSILRSLLLVLCAGIAAAAQAPKSTAAQSTPSSAAVAPEFEIRGAVVSGKTPLPGVTISAANSLTGKKVTTSTDPDGRYLLKVPGRGKYVVRAELTAFAAATSEVTINPATPQQKVDLEMTLLSRVPKEPANGVAAEAAQQLAGTLMGRGSQTLSVTADLGANESTGEGETPLAGMNALASTADAGNQSLSVSGQMGNTQDFGRNIDDMRERIEEMRARGDLPQGGGGFGGPGGGGPIMIFGGPGMMGGGGRVGRGGFNINKPHGMVYYSPGSSALDAAPYSLSGIPANKPDYGSNRCGATIGGPLSIPHVYQGGMKTMFIGGYTGTRSTNLYDVFSHV